MKATCIVIDVSGTDEEVRGAIQGVLSLMAREMASPPEVTVAPVVATKVSEAGAHVGKPQAEQAVATKQQPQVIQTSGTIAYEKYPARTAQGELSLCMFCQLTIRKGDRYYDGGYESRRAHVICAAKP